MKKIIFFLLVIIYFSPAMGQRPKIKINGKNPDKYGYYVFEVESYQDLTLKIDCCPKGSSFRWMNSDDDIVVENNSSITLHFNGNFLETSFYFFSVFINERYLIEIKIKVLSKKKKSWWSYITPAFYFVYFSK